MGSMKMRHRGKKKGKGRRWWKQRQDIEMAKQRHNIKCRYVAKWDYLVQPHSVAVFVL